MKYIREGVLLLTVNSSELFNLIIKETLLKHQSLLIVTILFFNPLLVYTNLYRPVFISLLSFQQNLDVDDAKQF